jgi:hypothetical protein
VVAVRNPHRFVCPCGSSLTQDWGYEERPCYVALTSIAAFVVVHERCWGPSPPPPIRALAQDLAPILVAMRARDAVLKQERLLR